MHSRNRTTRKFVPVALFCCASGLPGCGLSPDQDWRSFWRGFEVPTENVTFAGGDARRVVLLDSSDPPALAWARVDLTTQPPGVLEQSLSTPSGSARVAADDDWFVWHEGNSANPLHVVNLNTDQETEIALELEQHGALTLFNVDADRVLALLTTNPDPHHTLLLIDLLTGGVRRFERSPDMEYFNDPRAVLSGQSIVVAVDSPTFKPASFLSFPFPPTQIAFTIIDLQTEQRSPIQLDTLPYTGLLADGPRFTAGRIVWQQDEGVPLLNPDSATSTVYAHDIANGATTALVSILRETDGVQHELRVLDVDESGLLLVKIDVHFAVPGTLETQRRLVTSPLTQQFAAAQTLIYAVPWAAMRQSVQLLEWDGSTRNLRESWQVYADTVNSFGDFVPGGALLDDRLLLRDPANGETLLINRSDGATETIEVFPE